MFASIALRCGVPCFAISQSIEQFSGPYIPYNHSRFC